MKYKLILKKLSFNTPFPTMVDLNNKSKLDVLKFIVKPKGISLETEIKFLETHRNVKNTIQLQTKPVPKTSLLVPIATTRERIRFPE